MWTHRAFVFPGSLCHLPKKPPTREQAQGIFAAFKCELQALEKLLMAKRHQHAKTRRVDDPNLIYNDVAKSRALPVQSVVTKKHATVTKVSEDGLTVEYDPPDLVEEHEIQATHGWLRVVEHTPGRLLLEQEASLEVGDSLEQTHMHGTPGAVFQEFANLWEPMWQKHPHESPTRWEPFVQELVNKVPRVSTPMEMPPILREDWVAAVKAKKVRTSTGPDGVSRTDLLKMSPHLQEELVRQVMECDSGRTKWPLAQLVGHITAVEKKEGASLPGEFRPITVLTVPYRTWSSIRAKQCLKFLDNWADPGLRGNRPNQSTATIWWQISQEIETAIYNGQPLSGFVTDVCKAFNTLARPVVYACAIHFGLPLHFVRAWHDAVSDIQRHFIVGGACSHGIQACTGYPEGDPMSVVAMVLINMAMHELLQQRIMPLKVISFVDNWECKSSEAQATCRAYAAMEQFATMIDIKLDHKKTHFWAVQGPDRKFLQEQNHQVSHHTADLGGHVNYTRRFTNYTLRSRIQKAKVFWNLLHRSSSPFQQKLRAICTVAWPRSLHGASNVILGDEHIGRLRTAMMNAMRWNKKGASPVLQCMLLPPRCDPGYHVLLDTFLMFRNNCVPEIVFPMLTGLVLNPPKHFDPGPAGVFLSRLHQINWRWDHNGYILDHEDIRWSLLESPIQLLKMRLQHAWAAMMGASMSTRKEFEGLSRVDLPASQSTATNFPADGAGLLRTSMNGTFYTRNKQIHAGKVPSKDCPYCDQQDSVYHRIWECQGFSDLRAALPLEAKEFIQSMPPCSHLHGWIVESSVDRQFRHSLSTIPDRTGDFLLAPDGIETLHLFVDGSCTEPERPALRVATWGLCVANLPNQGFSPVGSGGVPGLYQTVLRGEITGAIAAFKFGLSRGAPFSIWTDNALVHKRIKEYATQGKAVLNGKRNDHDLWMTLQGLVCRACSRGLFQFVVKVTSHQEESQLDVVEEWAREGNECADRLAAMVQHQLPSQVRLLQGKLIYQHNRRHFACKHFHAMLVQFGLRCVEGKATVAHEDANRWADAKKLQEEEESQISLKGFTTDLVAPPSQRLGVCVQPLQQWLTQLLGQDDATPLWLSSYQLYAHYRMTTGHIGFYYDAASRKWDTAEGFVHEHGFNFLKMASWLQAITKEYAKLCELNCSALQCRSSHGAVRSRPTSDASSFRHHLVRLHWWTKLSVV